MVTLLLALVCGCGDRSSIAHLPGLTLSTTDLQSALAAEPSFTRRRFNTSLEEKKRYLDQLTRSRLLLEEARRQRIDEDPALVRRFQQMVVDTLIQRLRDKITAESLSDAEVQRFFEEHRADYEQPAMVRAGQILLGSRKEAEELRAELEGVKEAGERVQRFRSAAARRSTDEKTRYRGGDLGFLRPGSTGVPASLLGAALALKKVGELAPVVEAGPGSFAVLIKTGERAEVRKTFEQMKVALRFRLVNERRGKVIEELVEKLRGGELKLDERALAQVSAPEGEPQGSN